MVEQAKGLPREDRRALERSLSMYPGMVLNKTEKSILNPETQKIYHDSVVRFWEIKKLVDEIASQKEEEKHQHLFLKARDRAYFDWGKAGKPLDELQEQRDARFIQAIAWEEERQETAEQLVETITNGEVSFAKPLTEEGKREAAYSAWEEAGKPFEGDKEAKARFEEVVGRLEQQRADHFKNVLETWDQRIEEATKARLEGKEVNPQEILEKRIEVGEAEVAPIPPPEAPPVIVTPEGTLPEPEQPRPAEEAAVAAVPPAERGRARILWQAVVNVARTWLNNLNPRGKDRAWQLGVIAGSVESVAVIHLFGPGERWVKAGINFAAAQGVYGATKVYYGGKERKIRDTYKDNPEELERKIKEFEDTRILASGRIRNFFLGVSAGATYISAFSLGVELARGIGGALQEMQLGVPKPVGPVEAVTPSPVETPIPRVTPTPEVALTPVPEVPATPDFFDQMVKIEKPGDNFWRSFEVPSKFFAGAQENGWVNDLNGVTQEDVVRDLVIKFARANGKELGLVHVGDTFKLKDLLTSDQMEIVKKALATKSATDYWADIRPLFLAALKK